MKQRTPILRTMFSRFLYRASVLYRLGYHNGFREGVRFEVQRRPQFGAEVRKAAERMVDWLDVARAGAVRAADTTQDALVLARQEIARLQRILTINGIEPT